MATTITEIGKYQIVDVLGRGAMGIVYKGFDPMIQRHVAIKTIIMPDDPDQTDENLIRFKREAQAAGNLNNPNIVAIYEYVEEAGLAYIVMEYIDGLTLSDRMKQNDPLPLEQATQITKSILKALAHAHASGVVHRDIKPGNIMLTSNGTVKVADFGIARIESSELTMVGSIIGTPGYMSPEQLKGANNDARSDLFSAGIIFYEILTGQKAFAGTTLTSVIYKVINHELPSPSQLCNTLPEILDAVVTKAVNKVADERFQTANEFISAIDSALSHSGSGERTEPQVTEYLREMIPEAASKSKPPKHKKRGYVYSAGVGALIIAVLGLFFLGENLQEETTAEAQYEPGMIFKDCATCPSLVVIPAGHFSQGTPTVTDASLFNEAPERVVNIDYSFAVSRYEVTRQQYEEFISEAGYLTGGCAVYSGQWQHSTNMSWQNPGYEQDGNHPAVCISWEDAVAYTDWLSQKTAQTYRLLSASEWEYIARDAARNNTNTTHASDTQNVCDEGNVADLEAVKKYPGWKVSNCTDNFVHSAPVGTFKANGFGVFDLKGNVFEWVEDCWNYNYVDAPTDGSAWTSGDCQRRVLRGGSWFSQENFSRPTFRNSFKKHHRSSSFGFRVARQIANF